MAIKGREEDENQSAFRLFQSCLRAQLFAALTSAHIYFALLLKFLRARRFLKDFTEMQILTHGPGVGVEILHFRKLPEDAKAGGPHLELLEQGSLTWVHMEFLNSGGPWAGMMKTIYIFVFTYF